MKLQPSNSVSEETSWNHVLVTLFQKKLRPRNFVLDEIMAWDQLWHLSGSDQITHRDVSCFPIFRHAIHIFLRERAKGGLRRGYLIHMWFQAGLSCCFFLSILHKFLSKTSSFSSSSFSFFLFVIFIHFRAASPIFLLNAAQEKKRGFGCLEGGGGGLRGV